MSLPDVGTRVKVDGHEGVVIQHGHYGSVLVDFDDAALEWYGPEDLDGYDPDRE